MDPLTIITTIATTTRIVTTLSVKLYGFINDTRQVNNTLRTLHREVQSLENIITAIDHVLQRPTTQTLLQQDEDCDLGGAVNDSLVECKNTLEALDSFLDRFQSQDRLPTIIQQTQKQIKLRWRSDELCTLRVQMSSHSSAMQLALQTINV